jgi:hypothetical protein
MVSPTLVYGLELHGGGLWTRVVSESARGHTRDLQRGFRFPIPVRRNNARKRPDSYSATPVVAAHTP